MAKIINKKSKFLVAKVQSKWSRKHKNSSVNARIVTANSSSNHPKYEAGKHLLEFSRLLAKLRKAEFHSFLSEESVNEQGKSFYTHKCLRSAPRSLKSNLDGHMVGLKIGAYDLYGFNVYYTYTQTSSGDSMVFSFGNGVAPYT